MIQLTTKDADFIAGVIKKALKGLLNSFDDYKKDVENKAEQIKALKSSLPETDFARCHPLRVAFRRLK